MPHTGHTVLTRLRLRWEVYLSLPLLWEAAQRNTGGRRGSLLVYSAAVFVRSHLAVVTSDSSKLILAVSIQHFLKRLDGVPQSAVALESVAGEHGGVLYVEVSCQRESGCICVLC